MAGLTRPSMCWMGGSVAAHGELAEEKMIQRELKPL